jgi:hypothetical protein
VTPTRGEEFPGRWEGGGRRVSAVCGAAPLSYLTAVGGGDNGQSLDFPPLLREDQATQAPLLLWGVAASLLGEASSLSWGITAQRLAGLTARARFDRSCTKGPWHG